MTKGVLLKIGKLIENDIAKSKSGGLVISLKNLSKHTKTSVEELMSWFGEFEKKHTDWSFQYDNGEHCVIQTKEAGDAFVESVISSIKNHSICYTMDGRNFFWPDYSLEDDKK